jgi:hypothetical protein
MTCQKPPSPALSRPLGGHGPDSGDARRHHESKRTSAAITVAMLLWFAVNAMATAFIASHMDSGLMKGLLHRLAGAETTTRPSSTD